MGRTSQAPDAQARCLGFPLEPISIPRATPTGRRAPHPREVGPDGGAWATSTGRPCRRTRVLRSTPSQSCSYLLQAGSNCPHRRCQCRYLRSRSSRPTDRSPSQRSKSYLEVEEIRLNYARRKPRQRRVHTAPLPHRSSSRGRRRSDDRLPPDPRTHLGNRRDQARSQGKCTLLPHTRRCHSRGCTCHSCMGHCPDRRSRGATRPSTPTGQAPRMGCRCH